MNPESEDINTPECPSLHLKSIAGIETEKPRMKIFNPKRKDRSSYTIKGTASLTTSSPAPLEHFSRFNAQKPWVSTIECNTGRAKHPKIAAGETDKRKTTFTDIGTGVRKKLSWRATVDQRNLREVYLRESALRESCALEGPDLVAMQRWIPLAIIRLLMNTSTEFWTAGW